jgi:hypothetical protein
MEGNMATIKQELKTKIYMFTMILLLIGGLSFILSKWPIPEGNDKVIILIIGNLTPILGGIVGSISKDFRSGG